MILEKLMHVIVGMCAGIEIMLANEPNMGNGDCIGECTNMTNTYFPCDGLKRERVRNTPKIRKILKNFI